MIWSIAQAEDSTNILMVVGLIVVALGAGLGIFYAKKKTESEPEAPVRVAPKREAAPAPRVAEARQASSAPPTGVAPNAAAAGRAQIKNQLAAGQKLTVKPQPDEVPQVAASPTGQVNDQEAQDVSTLLHEANHLREGNHHEIAVQKLRNYLKIHPRESAVLECLGDILAERSDLSGAAETYRRSTHLDHSARVYEKLGKCLEAMGDMPGAIDAYRAATVADPNDHRAFNNLGGLLAETGDIRGGVEAFRRAVALNPTDSAAKENLAIAEEMLGSSSEGAAV